jgi:hypothetical protein
MRTSIPRVGDQTKRRCETKGRRDPSLTDTELCYAERFFPIEGRGETYSTALSHCFLRKATDSGILTSLFPMTPHSKLQ